MVAVRWLGETREQLTAAGTELEPVRAVQAQRWQGRFADLLDEDPGIEAELRALVEEIRAELPPAVVSASPSWWAIWRHSLGWRSDHTQ